MYVYIYIYKVYVCMYVYIYIYMYRPGGRESRRRLPQGRGTKVLETILISVHTTRTFGSANETFMNYIPEHEERYADPLCPNPPSAALAHSEEAPNVILP